MKEAIWRLEGKFIAADCPIDHPFFRQTTQWRLARQRAAEVHRCSSTRSPCFVMFFCVSCEGPLGK